MKILIIDNDEPCSNLIKIIIKKERHNASFEIATDSSSGLEIALKENFDLIFLNIEMPELDGFSVLEKLRKDRKYFETKIVAVTAIYFETKKMTSSGFDGVIIKPILKKEEILKFLENAG